LGKSVVHLVPKLRSDGDFGLSVESKGTSQTLPVTEVEVSLWGTPADPRHDHFRYKGPSPCFVPDGFLEELFGPGMLCLANIDFSTFTRTGTPSGLPDTPFVTNPSDCSAGPL